MNNQKVAIALVTKSASFHTIMFQTAEQTFNTKFPDRASLSGYLEEDPLKSLRWLFRFYALARQIEYGPLAEAALRAALNRYPLEHLMGNPLLVIKEFEQQVRWRHWKPNLKINGGVIRGLLQLVSQHQNLHKWAKSLLAAGRAEDLYLELLSIEGFGEKIAALIVRDLAWLYDLEEAVPIRDRLYLQPVDIWIERIFYALWPEFSQKPPKWIIAKKIAEACARWSLSGVQFNQGAWWFGSQEVKRQTALRGALLKLTQ